MADTLFQTHHVIEQQLAGRSRLLNLLTKNNLFNLNAPQNLLNLPTDRNLAQSLGVSPHKGGPLGSYSNRLADVLRDLETSPDFTAAIKGDQAALGRLAGRVDGLMGTLKSGLVNGDVFTNTPLGATRAATNARIAEFFSNIDQYAVDNAAQIDRLSRLTGPEALWAGITQSPQRMATLENFLTTFTGKLASGPQDHARELQQAFDAAVDANPHWLSRLGKFAGVLGAGLDALFTGSEVYDQFQSGDYRGAGNTIANFTGQAIGGRIGGALGAAGGAFLGTAVGGPGPGTAVGAVTGAVSGTIAGSAVGESWFDSGYDFIFGAGEAPPAPEAPVAPPPPPSEVSITPISATPHGPSPVVAPRPVTMSPTGVAPAPVTISDAGVAPPPVTPNPTRDDGPGGVGGGSFNGIFGPGTKNHGSGDKAPDGGYAPSGGGSIGDQSSGSYNGGKDNGGGSTTQIGGGGNNPSPRSPGPGGALGDIDVGDYDRSQGHPPGGLRGSGGLGLGNSFGKGLGDGISKGLGDGLGDSFGSGAHGGDGTPAVPVLLDLAGTGLSIDPLSSSSQFVDTDGDGFENRMAWAGSGNGVLVLDADGNGKISNSSEFVFTEWDPTASGDLEAIKSVFDTNHNGKLDAGDERWSEFKVMVDGQLVSLTSLDIASIDLTPTGSGQRFADGSAIKGTTTFTRTDGTTGAVGDAMLVTDGDSYAIDRAIVTNGDGSKTTTIEGRDRDGTLAFVNRVTVSADGLSKTTEFDDDGNGTFDRSQTDVTTIVAGERQRVVSNFRVDGSLANRTTTTTSADLKTVTTALDQDGDGVTNQTQVFVRNADGSTSTTVSETAVNGTLLRRILTTVSADGLTKTIQTDTTGHGYELITTEQTVVAGDGSRTKTVENRSSVGTLLSAETIVTNAAGTERTVSHDRDGSGVFELREVSVIGEDAQGNTVTTVSTFNAANQLVGKVTTTSASDGQSKTTVTDLDGNSTADLVSSQATVVGFDGSLLQTAELKSGNGSLLGATVTAINSDRSQISVVADINGDGVVDSDKTIIEAGGVTTTTERMLAANGATIAKTETQTSNGGQAIVSRFDFNGDNSYDVRISDTTVNGPSGSRVQTVTRTNDAQTVIFGSTKTTTSSDGLTRTVAEDANGDGTADLIATTLVAFAGDGSRTETITATSANGHLLSTTQIATSADRRTVITTIDGNGDGATDRLVTEQELADGSRSVTTVDKHANGQTRSSTLASRSADGLTLSVSEDINGDGTFDEKAESVTVIGTNGTRTITTSATSANGTLVSREIATVSGNGLNIAIDSDVNGDGAIDARLSDVAAFNQDGSSTRTVIEKSGNGAEVGRTVLTVSANGLSSTLEENLGGSTAIDRKTTTQTVIAASGATIGTVEIRSGDGTLLGKTTTAVSADRNNTAITIDANGDGFADTTRSILVNVDGSTTTTDDFLNANSTRFQKLETTVSGNGLSKTTKIDLNGDATYDRLETDTTILEADGDRVRTVTLSSGNGSDVLSRFETTTSANGLSTTVKEDIDGAGDFDKTTVASIALQADGSTVETVTVTNVNLVANKVLSKIITNTSADGRLVTATIDLNNDGDIDRTITDTIAADGIRQRLDVETTSTGSIIRQNKTAVSGDGLTATVSQNADGNGTFESVVIDQTVLGANGSRTRTITDQTAAGTMISKSVTTTSANGLAVTEQIHFDGDNAVDRETSDLTSIAADGATTRVVENRDRLGALIDKTTTITSADGLTKTVQFDMDGDQDLDRTWSTVSELRANGSVVETATVLRGDDLLLSKTMTDTSADRRTVSVTTDLDGNAIDDLTTTTTIGEDGVKTTTVSTFSPNGSQAQLTSKLIETVTANGLTIDKNLDTDGDGDIDKMTKSVTVLNANGSRKETITEHVAGVLKNTTVIDTSADGLSETTNWYATGGAVTRTTEDVTTLQSDGSTLHTVTYKKPGNLLESRTATRISADQLTTTVTLDIDGDTKDDRKSVSVIQANGSVITTLSDLAADGIAAVNTKTVTVAANGLTRTTSHVGDVLQTETIVLGPDGSTTETISFSGGGQTNESRSTSTSADGTLVTESWDFGLNGTIDASRETVTTHDASGSTTATSTFKTGATVNSAVQIIESANGLSTTTKWDSDGVSGYDQNSTDVTVLNANGTRTRTVTNTAGAATISSFVETVSADERTTTILEKRTGLADRTRETTTAVLADGSEVETFTISDAQSQILERQSTMTSAEGRETTIVREGKQLGIGSVVPLQTELRTKYVDGSQTSIISSLNSSGAVTEKTTATTSADGLTATTTWDLDGNGVTDRSRITRISHDVAGTTTTSEDRNAAGALLRKMLATISPDQRKTTIQRDVNGDGVFDSTETSVVAVSGEIVTTVVNGVEAQKQSNLGAGQIYWNRDSVADKVETTVSADGLTTTARSDFDGNGTYEVEEVSKTRIDGSIVSTVTEKNANGTVKAVGVSSVTADGRTRTLSKDVDNDGDYDVTEKAEIAIDGSAKLTLTDSSSGKTQIDYVNASGEFVRQEFTGPGGATGWNEFDSLGVITSGHFTGASLSNDWGSLEIGYVGGAQYSADWRNSDLSGVNALYDYNGSQTYSSVFSRFKAQNVLYQTEIYRDGGNIEITKYDTAANIWNTIVEYRNSAGTTTYVRQDNDDASYIVWSYDIAAVEEWNEKVTYVNENNLITQYHYVMNSGGIENVYYDRTGESWYRIEDFRQADNELTRAIQYNDNGSKVDTIYDPTTPNNASWTYIRHYYNSAGQETQFTCKYDAGNIEQILYDRDDATWSWIEQYMQGDGDLYKQIQHNDDSSSVEILYDVNAPTLEWDRQLRYYNPAGQITQYTYEKDSGVKDITLWDRGSAVWSWIEQHTNTQGEMLTQVQYNDNGTRVNIYDDPSKATTAYERRLVYWTAHTGGVMSQDTYERDNGTKQIWFYDALSNQAWTRRRHEYNTAGTLISSYTYWDDGTQTSSPIMLDMDGDNELDIEELNGEQEGPAFDWDQDGIADRTAWTNPTDGLLVIDLASGGGVGGDGVIDQAREVAFALWGDQSDPSQIPTDLDGLRQAFDSNDDGVLDASDDRWSEFRVWVDADQDGVSDAGELRTLADAGIVKLGLTSSSEGAAQFEDGSAIHGTSWFEMADGTQRLVADATFAIRPAVEYEIPEAPVEVQQYAIASQDHVAGLDADTFGLGADIGLQTDIVLDESLIDLEESLTVNQEDAAVDAAIVTSPQIVSSVDQLIAAIAVFEPTDLAQAALATEELQNAWFGSPITAPLAA